MTDYLTLGPTPAGEDCAQVGAENYVQRSRKESRAYINQLNRMFPTPDGVTAYFKVKAFPHDFGTYHEVCIIYDDDLTADVDFAFYIENNLPEEWDEEARKELGLEKGDLNEKV